jgi:hypothetical protein
MDTSLAYLGLEMMEMRSAMFEMRHYLSRMLEDLEKREKGDILGETKTRLCPHGKKVPE